MHLVSTLATSAMLGVGSIVALAWVFYQLRGGSSRSIRIDPLRDDWFSRDRSGLF